MIWLAWRQHRASMLAFLGAMGALAAFLVFTGFGMRSAFTNAGLDQCAAPIANTCTDAADQFLRKYQGFRFLIPLLLIVPALFGVFWGAPLVAREVEQGTHRLVWTQSITRQRWLNVKVVMLAVATVALVGAITWLSGWWTAPLMAAQPQRFDAGVFDLLGVVPLAYALAALAIGVAAGTFTRKLVPAIAITLVAFLGVRAGVDVLLRPNFMAPVMTDVAFPAGDGRRPEFPQLDPDLGWILSMQTLDASGRVISDGVGFEARALAASCPELRSGSGEALPDPTGTAACVQRIKLHVDIVYQPADRYWRFQLTEAALYLVLAVALIGASAWGLRRRIT